MKKKELFCYGGHMAAALGLGALSGYVSRPGIDIYVRAVDKPPLAPPRSAFPIAWSLLYLLMGWGAARVSLGPDCLTKQKALRLYYIQLAVNLAWPPIFFLYQAYGFALMWLLLLWALALGMLLLFHRCDRLAGLGQIPYLMWLAFAVYLSLGVWVLN